MWAAPSRARCTATFGRRNDVDVIANLREEHASRLRAELEADYYVDEESIRDAVRHRSSFNLAHFGTGLKEDVFVAAPGRAETNIQSAENYSSLCRRLHG